MRHPSVSKRWRLAASLATLPLMVAACGLTDDGVRPGAAAELDGQRLELSRVDQAVQDYCSLLAVNEQAVASATSSVRAQFMQGWTQAVAVDHLAEEEGIDLPPESIDRAQVEQVWGDLGAIDDENYDTFEWLTWISLRLNAPLEALGSKQLRAETGQSVGGDQAVSRGIQLVTDWLEDNPPDINPVFGVYDDETAVFNADGLSVPVSDEAAALVDTSKVTAEQVSALPANQRCGPETAPAPQVPGA